MPTKIEKDAISGQETTGHEWDGLKELNTPLPKWWVYVFFVCIAWAVVLMILYPSVPYGSGYWHGVLGYSSRVRVDREVAKLVAKRKPSMDKIAQLPYSDIKANPKLMEVALVSGRITFENNCQPCHGAGGSGNIGFPALAAGAWIWGGTLDAIQQTVTYGVRAGDPKGRPAVAMPSFGADGILKPEQVQQVTDFVWEKFYGHNTGKDVSAGAKIFAQNCAACHGPEGMGNRAIGAPRLASHVHLYGDLRSAIVRQVNLPRLGVMPAWGKKLTPAEIKSVTLYVHSLGGGE